MSQVKSRLPEQSKITSLPILGEQPKSEKEEKHLKEVCNYEFYNLEESGLNLSFCYGNTRFQKNFLFMHGAVYKVPRHVARHIENRTTPIWAWRPDGTGRMQKQKVGEKPRFQMREKFEG